METPTNNLVDKPSNEPENNSSPVTNTSTSQPTKDDQFTVDQSCIAGKNITNEPNGTVNQVKPKSVETVLMETTEDVNKNDQTKADSVTSNSERNEFETEGEIKDSALLDHPSLPAPPARPLTLPPQLPQNRSVSEQPETIGVTQRSPPRIETKSCTVRLKILTEADIVKHIHVH